MCLVIVVAVIVVAAAVVFGERASHSQVCSIKNHYIYYGTYVTVPVKRVLVEHLFKIELLLP